MKLYYFKPKDYGQEYFVCAKNREKAILYLRNEALTRSKKSIDYQLMMEAVELKNGYSLLDYEPGEIAESEIC